MSIVPVAEALQRLEIEGLLESRPQAGTRVKVPNAEEIRGRFDLRQALECESARLCAERASSQELLELKKLAANLDALQSKRAARNHDDDFAFRVNEHHVELHMRIAEYSHSEVLRAEIKKTHVLVFNWLYDTTREGRDLPPNFHAHLIQAIASGHPQKADDVMRAHVMIGLESTLNAMEPLQRLNWRVLPSRLAPIRRLPAATPTGR